LSNDSAHWNALAWSHLQAGRSDLGLDAARRAHEASRGNPDYLNTLGVAYAENGELALAEAAFRKLLRRRPGSADALMNLAKTLEKLERLDEALALYERALAIDAGYPGLAATVGRVYREHGGQAARARAVLEKHARHVAPEELVLGLASCDLELAGVDAASARLAAALSGHPEWRRAREAYAHSLLSAGRFADGWREYLARSARPAPPCALHPSGEVLLLSEQGLGDVLFFLRFARRLDFSLACDARLRAILPEVPTIARQPDQQGVPLGDLPALLESTDTPPAWPLAASEASRADARSRLAALGPRPYIGVTWRAGTDSARGRELGAERIALTKAVDPAALGAALRGWRGTVVLLQRGARVGERESFEGGLGAGAHDLAPLTDDLAALLGLLAEIDEYVGVSNTNMHLLAGLGRRAQVLVPYPAEWRWLRREGRSPWFPAFPVYRQAQSRDWSPALDSLRTELGL
jgi:Tfp pilus assembly protein PilF